MKQSECKLYEKHHNVIDGVYMTRLPEYWCDVPMMDKIDAEDEDNELYNLFQDVKIYDIETLEDFNNPSDKHNIDETIFIIRKDGEYFLCESQGEEIVKFSVNISNVSFIEQFDRTDKVNKIYEKMKGN